MTFRVKIEPEAHDDIQQGIDWYNNQQKGLGAKFHSIVKTYFSKLKANPFFQKRYGNVHCLPIKKYPFMIHFTIDEKKKEVIVRAVFHTSLNPNIWSKR